MARLYADEQFPLPVVRLLRVMGHDVLTVQEADQVSGSDPEVLAFAISTDRVVLTQNRRHFIKLHNQQSDHTGIIVCTVDPDVEGLAQRIHKTLMELEVLNAQLIRVNRS
jgi:uncharacterized protein with PIN domain